MDNNKKANEESFDAMEIAETYINGNISDAREAIGGNIARYNMVLEVLEELGDVETIKTFKQRMAS